MMIACRPSGRHLCMRECTAAICKKEPSRRWSSRRKRLSIRPRHVLVLIAIFTQRSDFRASRQIQIAPQCRRSAYDKNVDDIGKTSFDNYHLCRGDLFGCDVTRIACCVVRFVAHLLSSSSF